jgi:GT2 family glycosyltransferase
VSVVIVGYQSRADLPECLGSVLDQDYPGETEVIFVDNASTDGSADFVRAAFPGVTVVESGGNAGYAGGTNLGFRRTRGEYLISLNPDTTVDRHFVGALVDSALAHGDRALVTSRILYYGDPEMINIYGNDVNFGLVASCRAIGEPRSHHTTEVDLPSISGTAFLIPRSVLTRIGPFEAKLHLYLEDTDLSLRALLAGYRCVTAPESLVFHKYQLKMGPSKFYYIERNRWVVMLRTYRLGTVLVLLPGLLAIEALVWIGAAKLGRHHLWAKTRSYGGVARMIPAIRRGRRQVRELRRISDRQVLDRLQGPLPIGLLVPRQRTAQTLLTFVNFGFSAYFRLTRRLVRW